MSALTDLFEGNFSNLGNDITHAPSSLVNHPDELAETLGGVALIAAPFAAPELFGLGGAAGIGLGEGAADLTAANAAFGAFDSGAFAADIAAGGGEAVAGLGGDALGVGADTLAMGGALGSDVLPDTAGLTTGSLDLGGGSTAAPYSWTAADVSGPGIGADVTSNPAVTAYENPEFQAGGFGQTVKDFASSPYTKLAAGLAPLGIALGMGGAKLPAGLGPAEANATALASQGSNLNASQQASLTQMRQNAVNAARQAMFNQGVQNPESDTRWSQMVTNIDSQVTAAAQTMIQQNIQNSLAGDAQLIQIAQLQMTSDQNFANMLMNATKAFGTSIGLGGGQTFKLSPA